MTKGRTKKASTRSGWRTISPNPAEIAPLLRECGFVADDADPISVTAHFDRQNRPRRVHAIYPNGWRATLSLRLDGTYSLSQAIRMVSRKAEA